MVLGPATGHAVVKPNALFTEGAVLQQGMAVPVWGTADDGEKVTVKFQGQVISTVAKDGRWLVRLKPLKVGGPFTMTISGMNTVEVKDLLVGEVWLCGGQSNMEMQLMVASNAKEAIAASADPQLRLCTVRASRGVVPQREVSLIWRSLPKNGSGYANNFSAVGYFFGRDLRKAVKVPVGLIHASVGATAIGWWMNREAWDTIPADMRQQVIAELQNNASVLYNGMIAPLQPCAIRGVIWYQGESDSHHPGFYQVMLPAMIEGWRKVWNQTDSPADSRLNFTFLFAQVAPNNRWPPEIREAQLLAWQATSNTMMTVNTDCGDPVEIHPPNKEPVGVRLALAARAIAYGEKIEYSGPICDSMQVKGDKAVISFRHAGGGLEARGGPLKGFVIAGADEQFVAAQAVIDGTRVVVTSPQVRNPAVVRYGWANTPDVNLYNKEGLPASPFRTDLSVAK